MQEISIERFKWVVKENRNYLDILLDDIQYLPGIIKVVGIRHIIRFHDPSYVISYDIQSYSAVNTHVVYNVLPEDKCILEELSLQNMMIRVWTQ